VSKLFPQIIGTQGDSVGTRSRLRKLPSRLVYSVSEPADIFFSSPIRDLLRQFMITMAVPERYADRLVSLDRDCLILRRYYFPLASPKKIRLDCVEHIEIAPATLLSGRFRLWGSSDFLLWCPLDLQRFRREKVYTVKLKDRAVRPRFTVEQSDGFEAVLKSCRINIHNRFPG
jgi:hypothetical protein